MRKTSEASDRCGLSLRVPLNLTIASHPPMKRICVCVCVKCVKCETAGECRREKSFCVTKMEPKIK